MFLLAKVTCAVLHLLVKLQAYKLGEADQSVACYRRNAVIPKVYVLDWGRYIDRPFR